MKKFLMGSLLAMSALTMMPNVSVQAADSTTAAPVEDEATRNARFWIDEVTVHRLAGAKFTLRLRDAGFATVDDEEFRKMVEFVANFLKKPEIKRLDEEAKVVALAELFKKALKSRGFFARHGYNLLVASVVGGFLAADMGYLGEKLTIGEAGKLDAHTVLWAKVPSMDSVKAFWADYAPTWLGGTPVAHKSSGLDLPVCDIAAKPVFANETCSVPADYYNAADLLGKETGLVSAKFYGVDLAEEARLAQEAADQARNAEALVDRLVDVELAEQARLAQPVCVLEDVPVFANQTLPADLLAAKERIALLGQEIQTWEDKKISWLPGDLTWAPVLQKKEMGELITGKPFLVRSADAAIVKDAAKALACKFQSVDYSQDYLEITLTPLAQ